MFFRALDTTLTTDFKVRLAINGKAASLLPFLTDYEPMLTSISVPGSPVSFGRKGILVEAAITEPSFSFSYIPVRQTFRVGDMLHSDDDPLKVLHSAQYSDSGLLIPLGGTYSITDGIPTQADGLYYSDGSSRVPADLGFTFPIWIEFQVYNTLSGRLLYQFRNCRFTLMPSALAVSGEEFVTYNVAVAADSVAY